MKTCPQCGGSTEVTRTVVEGGIRWREHRCTKDHSHVIRVSMELAANAREYYRVRARDSARRRKLKDADTPPSSPTAR